MGQNQKGVKLEQVLATCMQAQAQHAVTKFVTTLTETEKNLTEAEYSQLLQRCLLFYRLDPIVRGWLLEAIRGLPKPVRPRRLRLDFWGELCVVDLPAQPFQVVFETSPLATMILQRSSPKLSKAAFKQYQYFFLLAYPCVECFDRDFDDWLLYFQNKLAHEQYSSTIKLWSKRAQSYDEELNHTL